MSSNDTEMQYEISPLTGEVILNYRQVLCLAKKLKENNTAILLGGDILSQNNQYIPASWYYNPDTHLSRTVNIRMSCEMTEGYLKTLQQKETMKFIPVLDIPLSAQAIMNLIGSDPDQLNICN